MTSPGTDPILDAMDAEQIRYLIEHADEIHRENVALLEWCAREDEAREIRLAKLRSKVDALYGPGWRKGRDFSVPKPHRPWRAPAEPSR